MGEWHILMENQWIDDYINKWPMDGGMDGYMDEGVCILWMDRPMDG